MKAKKIFAIVISFFLFFPFLSACGNSNEGQIQPHDHIAGPSVVENNVEPDCTNDGHYDLVRYCTICNEELSRETIVTDKLGHTDGEHKVEIIMPPADQYTYKQEEDKHIFTKITAKVTDTITIDEKEKTVRVLSEPEGMRAAYYQINEYGETIELS